MFKDKILLNNKRLHVPHPAVSMLEVFKEKLGGLSTEILRMFLYKGFETAFFYKRAIFEKGVCQKSKNLMVGGIF